MNEGMKWLLMSMLVSLSSSRFCSNSGNCSCQKVSHWKWRIRCPSDSSPRFIASHEISVNEFRVECHNATSWSEFEYQYTPPAPRRREAIVEIARCPLPDESLGQIIGRFLLSPAYYLTFTSHMNLSTTLTRRHLSMLPELRALNLSSNGLTELSSDVFQNLDWLVQLDLSFNRIAVLPRDIFHGLSVLGILELSYNAIKFVDAGLFSSCTDLTELSMKGNLITTLDHRTFRDKNMLYIIDLAENLLETLPPDTFEYTEVRVLDISGNWFSTLPERLFSQNTLQKLTFSHNRGNLTILPNNFLNNLTELQVITLIQNKLTSLPENIFWDSFFVESIDLHGNALSELPKNIFRDSRELIYLDLSDNRLNSVPEGLFGGLGKLRRLNLGRNSIVSLTENIFENLDSLLELNLEINNIADIHSETFRNLQNIQLIRLSHNFVDLVEFWMLRIGKYFSGPTIRLIFLDHNNLTGAFSVETYHYDNPINLQFVDLSGNQINKVQVRGPVFGFRNVEYDLTHNNLQSIRITGEIYSKVRILVDDNPLHCGCAMYTPLKYAQKFRKPQPGQNLEITLGNASCSEPYWMKTTPLASLRPKTFTCRPEYHSLFMRCAEGCDCWWRPDDKTRIVDCSSRQFAKMPKKIIGLAFEDDSDEDSGLVDFVDDQTLWGDWRSTRVELDLANNSLMEIPILKLSAYEHVEKLILSHNNIFKLSFDVLPPKLKTLHLDHNDLEKFGPVASNAIINSETLEELNLEGNPWSCDSDTRSALESMEIRLGPNLRYDMKKCLDYRNPPNIEETSTLYISYTIF